MLANSFILLIMLQCYSLSYGFLMNPIGMSLSFPVVFIAPTTHMVHVILVLSIYVSASFSFLHICIHRYHLSLRRQGLKHFWTPHAVQHAPVVVVLSCGMEEWKSSSAYCHCIMDYWSVLIHLSSLSPYYVPIIDKRRVWYESFIQESQTSNYFKK